MTPDEQNLDMLVAELDRENRLLRARNERLERQAEQRKTWIDLTDNEKLSVCRVGPVYAPDGVVTRKPFEYRKELEGVALMAVRQAEVMLREKNK